MKTTLVVLLALTLVSRALLAADARVSAAVNIGEPAAAAADKRKGKGPPPWAPAHGYRAKYRYTYYPAHEVYHRPSDGVWFYYENGKWAAGARLPLSLKVDVATGVPIEMDADKPYSFHADVKLAFPKNGAGKSGDDRAFAAESPKPPGNGKGKGRSR